MLAGPKGLYQSVSGGEPVPVEDEICEQESALAPWQAGLETLTIPFDDGRPAELDSRRWHRRQGHANILSTVSAYKQ
jgi:hypothetical protein